MRLHDWVRGDPVWSRLIANSGWLFSSTAITNVLRLGQGAMLARMLGVKGYGILGLVLAYSTSIKQLVDSQVSDAAIKFVNQYVETGESDKAAAFIKLSYLIELLTAAATLTLLLTTAGLAAKLFLKDPASAEYIQLYSLAVVMAFPIGMGSALLRTFQRFDWVAYTEVGSAFLSVSGIILVWFLGGGIFGIIWIYILTNGINGMAALLLAHKVTLQRIRLHWIFASLKVLKRHAREIARFLLSTNASMLCKLLQRNADILLVGYFLTPVAAGYFKLARMLTDVAVLPLTPLEGAWYPEFAGLWHQNRLVELRRLVHKLAFLSSVVGVGALLIYAVAGKWMIEWSVGRQYLPALPALRLLGIGVSLAVASSFAYHLLLAMGQAPQTLLAIAAGVAVQVPLLVFWIPRFGINGAAAAYAVFYVVWIAVIFRFLGRSAVNVTE